MRTTTGDLAARPTPTAPDGPARGGKAADEPGGAQPKIALSFDSDGTGHGPAPETSPPMLSSLNTPSHAPFAGQTAWAWSCSSPARSSSDPLELPPPPHARQQTREAVADVQGGTAISEATIHHLRETSPLYPPPKVIGFSAR